MKLLRIIELFGWMIVGIGVLSGKSVPMTVYAVMWVMYIAHLLDDILSEGRR